MLDAHSTKLLDTDEAPEGFSKKLFTSTSFMGLIATFVRQNSDTTVEDKKYSTCRATKGLVGSIPTFDDERG